MDNGAMIAHQGMLQLEAGMMASIEDSGSKPNWRPDEVEVEWI
jgi:tRNA A37 threonylcarbamoyltransferase TsaD